MPEMPQPVTPEQAEGPPEPERLLEEGPEVPVVVALQPERMAPKQVALVAAHQHWPREGSV